MTNFNDIGIFEKHILGRSPTVGLGGCTQGFVQGPFEEISMAMACGCSSVLVQGLLVYRECAL